MVEPLEGELYDWIVRCLEGSGTNIRAYDIYFLDKEGNRYEVTEPLTLSFSLNGLMRTQRRITLAKAARHRRWKPR